MIYTIWKQDKNVWFLNGQPSFWCLWNQTIQKLDICVRFSKGLAIWKLDKNVRHSGAIWIPDHLQTGQLSTIRIPDLSGIQMVTVYN